VVLQSQVFKCNRVCLPAVCQHKRAVQISFFLTIIIITSIIPVPAAEKLEFAFEKDRESKQTGNVRQVESRSTYNARHIDQIKNDVDILKKEMEAIKGPVAEDGTAKPPATDARLGELELSIGNLQAKLEEISSANDEITRSYNELMANVEQLLQANILVRLQRLEQAEKAGTAANDAPAATVAEAEKVEAKEDTAEKS
jgi:hypothetical protein